ncbi:MAG: hypothetical protein JWP12_3924 [Bacteroidetes bacterium]|nr:hypothetical protein [Bacteroidota bacterium]
MLKKLNMLLLILTASLAASAQDITATVKTVSSAAPGKDFTVEITVNKAGVSGFMKYFQELPANYTATDIDSKGGNFTFADNGAKIIWISPPSTDQFVITYKITVPAGASGTLSIGGKFSYVMGNERKVFDIAPQAVSIGGSAPAPTPVKTEPVKESTPAPAETKPVVAETPKPTPASTPAPVAEKPKPVETKKEAPPVVTKPTPAPVPATAAAASIPGRTYKVQIGAFSQKPHIDGVSEPSTLQLDNGMTKYFSGNFKTYDEAVKRKKEMIDKGFQGAFIVAFENGKIVK